MSETGTFSERMAATVGKLREPDGGPVQVIVMRRRYPDGKGGLRGITAGKQIAQGSHASMAFLTRRIAEALPLEGSLPGGRELLHDWTRKDRVEVGVYGLGLRLTAAEIEWMVTGKFTKICLQVEGEEELLEVYTEAKARHLTVHLISDSGQTEFGGVQTHTCLAIGPHYKSEIAPVTGHLKLL